MTLKTVEVHLGRTYGKLDTKGRSQLAAALGVEADAPAPPPDPRARLPSG